jgi:hypothetical protein
MAERVFQPNEISLNGVRYPITRPVQAQLASIYPPKVTLGDTSKDSQTRTSVIAWSDWRGGIGIDRMESSDTSRAWWSTCQLRFKDHLILGNLPTKTDTIDHELSLSGAGTGIATINEFDDKLYVVWNGASDESPLMYVYNHSGVGSDGVIGYWWDGRGEDIAIGVHGDDEFNVPDQVTDSLNFTSDVGTNYLVLAHYDTTNSGYSYATVPSYMLDVPNNVYVNANWVNDTKDTKYLTEWDDRLWGISHAGQLWYSLTLGTEIDDAQLPLPAGYVTGLFVARDSAGEPIIYASSKKGLWAHDANNARFVKTEVELPFHPHAGKGARRWRDSVYFTSGLGLYKYQNGSNAAVLSVVGPDRDDGLPEDKRGTIMLTEGTHNELLVGVDATTAPTITSSEKVPYQWKSNFGSPVADPSTGYSSILGYNELGWETKWLADTAGRSIDAMHVSNAYSDVNENYRLWFGFNDYVYYMKLPVDIINPSMVTEFEYAVSGTHETPWFSGGQSEVDKLALRLKTEVQDVSGDETVTVSYATNYSETYITAGATITSTTLGSVTSGITTYTFGDNAGTTFRAIKFKIDLARSSSDDDKKKTPDVVSLTLEWRKKLAAKWGHTCQVDLNRDYGGRSPKELRAALVTAIESSTLVEFTFRDDDGDTRNYYTDVVSATGLENTGHDERGVATISLVEA